METLEIVMTVLAFVLGEAIGEVRQLRKGMAYREAQAELLATMRKEGYIASYPIAEQPEHDEWPQIRED